MFVRFAGLFRKKQHETEMNEELRAHLDGLIERNVAAGMSSDDARFSAMRAFGGVAQIQERARDERRSPWGEEVLHDLHYAFRQLRKTPGFTAVAVLSLALGIGANTAIFSIVNEVLLRALPVKRPDELVLLQNTGRIRANSPHWIQGTGGLSPVVLDALRQHSASLVELFAFAPLTQLNAIIDGQPEIVPLSQVVTGNYYATLGVAPRVGRLLVSADDQPEAPPVAVISDRYWRNRFNRDLAAIGKTVWLNSVPVTIVGVTPAGFSGTLQVVESPDFSVSLALAPRLKPDPQRRFELNQPSYWWLRTMGRLRPGVTAEQVRTQLDDVYRESIFEYYPETRGKPEPPHLQVRLAPQGLDEVRRTYRSSLLVLTGIVALVLIVACVNIANLLLARAAARRREIAVRLALGASRGRIVRQLLTESILLALLGAAGGALVAWWGGEILLRLLPTDGSALTLEFNLNGRVLGFTAVVAITTGVLFGLVPALRATRVDLNTEFQGGARTNGRGGRTRLMKSLMISQLALSLVLLVGAGLFVRTLRSLQRVDAGFNPSHLLFRLDAAATGRDRFTATSFYEAVRTRVATVPGVRNISLSYHALLSDTSANGGGGIFGYKFQPGQKTIGGDYNGVGPEFFATVGIPMLLGRDFEERDMPPTAEVVAINQSLARETFGTDNPIGQRTSFGEVIRVVADARYDQLRRAPAPTAYVPFERMRWPGGQGNFAVRTSADPRAILGVIREIVRQLDPKLPLYDVRTQNEQIDRLLWQERVFAGLAGFFGGLAALLVCVGLYGLMSFAVLQRTGEIGIRMALGAAPGQVHRMILRESLAVLCVGTAIGVIAASLASRLIAKLLYGLAPTDPTTFGVVTLLLIAVALVAALLPARRASKIDPLVALRAE